MSAATLSLTSAPSDERLAVRARAVTGILEQVHAPAEAVTAGWFHGSVLAGAVDPATMTGEVAEALTVLLPRTGESRWEHLDRIATNLTAVAVTLADLLYQRDLPDTGDLDAEREHLLSSLA